MRRHPCNLGRTLVAGSRVYGSEVDRRRLYDDAFGVDLVEGDGVDMVHDLEYALPESVGLFEHIDCCSVLEHVARPWLFCASLEAAMTDQATILVSVPFVWRLHAYPNDYWRISTASLSILFPSVTWVEIGYLVDGRLRSLVPSLDLGSKRYMERAETVGFGVKCVSKF